MTIKQQGGIFGRNPTFNNVSVETLSIDGTAISSTAAELNILDGVTADSTEINYLDGASTSVVTASKAVLANASANIAFASGKGIDFSATAGTGTSELFDDYEEGTFTCTDASGGGNAIVTNYAVYTKIGNAVTISLYITVPGGATGAGALLGGLPFAPATLNNVMVAQNNGGLDIIAKTNTSSFLVIYPSGSLSASTWLNLAGDNVYITGTYYV